MTNFLVHVFVPNNSLDILSPEVLTHFPIVTFTILKIVTEGVPPKKTPNNLQKDRLEKKFVLEECLNCE